MSLIDKVTRAITDPTVLQTVRTQLSIDSHGFIVSVTEDGEVVTGEAILADEKAEEDLKEVQKRMKFPAEVDTPDRRFTYKAVYAFVASNPYAVRELEGYLRQFQISERTHCFLMKWEENILPEEDEIVLRNFLAVEGRRLHPSTLYGLVPALDLIQLNELKRHYIHVALVKGRLINTNSDISLTILEQVAPYMDNATLTKEAIIRATEVMMEGYEPRRQPAYSMTRGILNLNSGALWLDSDLPNPSK